MWDVKKTRFVLSAISPWFYLNYVGCKVATISASVVAILLRFTLTMWDVKPPAASKPTELNAAFYLNYVGCKGK